MDYSGIALSIWVLCLVQAGLSACLPTSCLVEPTLVATQEIDGSNYIVSHVVGPNACNLHQTNEVPPLPKGLFLCTKHLGEIVQDFWMFLINCHTLWYSCIAHHPADHSILSIG